MAVPNLNDVAGPLPGAVPPAPVPVAAPAPAAPVPVPPSSAAPSSAAPVQAPDPIAIAGQNLGESQAIGKEVNAATQEKTALEQELAAKKAQDDARHAQALDQFLQQQQLHRQAADAEISAKRQQYESAPFHSLWSTRTTGQKVAIALGILAGGIGWDSNHQNRALQVLQDAEQEDFARQKEQHADLWRDLQLSLDNRKELDARQLHELSDWQAQEGAKWAAVASKLNAALAANKGRFESTDARKAALEATEKSNTAYQNAIAAKAAANHTDAQTRLELEQVKNQPGIRAKNAAETAKANAEASESPSKIAKNNAEAQAYLANGVSAFGAPNTPDAGIPVPGSKVDNAIMSKYINPARKAATTDKVRVLALQDLNDALKDPNLTYGQVKQVLINAFTANGNNPQGKIAVADIHEVLPGMQSTLGKFLSDLNQGGDNKATPEFKQTVAREVARDLDSRTKIYKQNGDTLEKNLGPIPAQAKRHYRNQLYPELEAPTQYSPELQARARKALEPNSGATDAEKAAALTILGK